MIQSKLPQEDKTVSNTLATIQQSLEAIKKDLMLEIASKQGTINLYEEKLSIHEILIYEKDAAIKELNRKLEDANRTNEGNRQLVNKLLNDIGRLNQDISWYKRTYETRSFLGTIKQKLFKR